MTNYIDINEFFSSIPTIKYDENGIVNSLFREGYENLDYGQDKEIRNIIIDYDNNLPIMERTVGNDWTSKIVLELIRHRVKIVKYTGRFNLSQFNIYGSGYAIPRYGDFHRITDTTHNYTLHNSDGTKFYDSLGNKECPLFNMAFIQCPRDTIILMETYFLDPSIRNLNLCNIRINADHSHIHVYSNLLGFIEISIDDDILITKKKNYLLNINQNVRLINKCFALLSNLLIR